VRRRQRRRTSSSARARARPRGAGAACDWARHRLHESGKHPSARATNIAADGRSDHVDQADWRSSRCNAGWHASSNPGGSLGLARLVSKPPGSRVIGFALMRERLIATAPRPDSRIREAPGLFVVKDDCPNFIRTIPVLAWSSKTATT
jgi:hypothetical protein